MNDDIEHFEVFALRMKALQLECQDLKSKLKVSEEEVVELKAKLEVHEKRQREEKKGKKKEKQLAPDSTDEPTFLKPNVLGKKFVTMYELWVLPNIQDLFTQPLQPPPFAHDDASQRYPDMNNDNTDQLLLGAQADLFYIAPRDRYPLMHSAQLFHNPFRDAMSDHRSGMVRRVKDHMREIYGRSFEDKSSWDALSMLKWRKTDKTYPLYPPLIFENFVNADEGRFRNAILYKIAKCALYGPSSLYKKVGTPTVNAKLWCVNATTPGLIAFATTLAVFVCSADTEFSQIGNQTSIDYRVLHLSVKRLLHLTADSEFTKGVMAHFNKHVFGHTITATEHIDISQADKLPEDMEEPDLIARLKSFSVSNPEPEPESDVSTDDEDMFQDSKPPLPSPQAGRSSSLVLSELESGEDKEAEYSPSQPLYSDEEVSTAGSPGMVNTAQSQSQFRLGPGGTQILSSQHNKHDYREHLILAHRDSSHRSSQRGPTPPLPGTNVDDGVYDNSAPRSDGSHGQSQLGLVPAALAPSQQVVAPKNATPQPDAIRSTSAGSKHPEAKGKGRSKATADVTKSGTSANIEKLAVAKTAKPKARPIKKKKQDVVEESVTIINGDRPEVQPEGSPSRDKSRRVLRAASSRV